MLLIPLVTPPSGNDLNQTSKVGCLSGEKSTSDQGSI
jgi:hypothetical protein